MSVEERLSRLEKSVRYWRWTSWALAAVLLIVAIFVCIDQVGLRGTIRAKRIIVRGEKGTAIELESSSTGDGLISINDSKSLTRVLLGTSQRGFGTVELYGGDEQRVVLLGGSGSGGQIALYNNEKKKVVDMQATKSNCGAVIVSDFDGRQVNHMSAERR